MALQPRILEPSKPKPSVKMSSPYSLRVVVKCCQVPRRSANLKSISLIPLSLIKEVTSAGVINDAMVGGGLRLRGLTRDLGLDGVLGGVSMALVKAPDLRVLPFLCG